MVIRNRNLMDHCDIRFASHHSQPLLCTDANTNHFLKFPSCGTIKGVIYSILVTIIINSANKVSKPVSLPLFIVIVSTNEYSWTEGLALRRQQYSKKNVSPQIGDSKSLYQEPCTECWLEDVIPYKKRKVLHIWAKKTLGRPKQKIMALSCFYRNVPSTCW